MSLKPIIKSAREALDRKDFDYALQLCNDALEFEPDNYLLLIFRAVALTNKQSIPDALTSYNRAFKSQPDNPLALQGILSVYDNQTIPIDESYVEAAESLLKIYSQQLTIFFNSFRLDFLERSPKSIQAC